MTVSLSSCDAVFDDLEPCRTGAEMRFIFDRNLENSNLIHSNVDCLSVYIYDADGRYVTSLTETSDRLADENWRLRGTSRRGLQGGGIRRHDVRRVFPLSPVAIPERDSGFDALQVRLKPEHAGKRLHDHYHGVADFTVDNHGDNEFGKVPVSMTRTTNHFRILMQNLSGAPSPVRTSTSISPKTILCSTTAMCP